VFNAAVTVGAMRRLMMQSMSITIPDVPQPEVVPPVIARILLGGKVDSYSGFLPGIFEEALVTLTQQRPVYILGGFGGAAEILADAILASGSRRPEELVLEWHKKQNPGLVKLLEYSHEFTSPKDFAGTESSLDALFGFVQQARGNLSATLNTGLSNEETRELLKTQNIANAVHLVRTGLVNMRKLPTLAA
jgi:hypothetical protein